VPRYELSGKIALITGGARGIGFGLAEALVARGATVAVVDLSEESAQQAAAQLGEGRAIGLAADVTDRSAIEGAVRETVTRLGGLDVVVANAGVAPSPPSPVRVMPQTEFERVVEVDLLGVYRTVSAAMEQVVSRRGQVVVISSIYAFANGMINAPYAVAKAGVEQLGRALRVELSIHGVGVTVAYFGFVDTEMVRQAFEQGRARTGRDPGEDLPAFMLKRITPRQAGEALARGIERRQPRVIAPRWWTIGWVLRGLLAPPMDHLATRDPRIRRALRDSEAASVRPLEGTGGDRTAEVSGEEVSKEAGSLGTGSLPSAAPDVSSA
jgi:NAD(P)-dependent dehydrogenase (short-subunit alcohol dehydrogenase family)